MSKHNPTLSEIAGPPWSLPETPPTYLATWREILVALGFKFNQEDKRKVARLNKTYSGPIEVPGQGKQPFVEKTSLLAWWKGLEATVRESQQRKVDTQATVANLYDYGHDGTVVPDLSGGMKRRRKDRKP